MKSSARWAPAATESHGALVLIASDLPDWPLLLESLPVGATVIGIPPGADVLERALAATSADARFSDLHLIAHGQPGELALGIGVGARHLQLHAREWKALASRLAPGAQVAVHACQLGARARGRRFVGKLAGLLRRPLAAASGMLGAGHWRLDVRTAGATLPPLQPLRYAHQLAADPIGRSFAGSTSSYAYKTGLAFPTSALTADLWLKTTDTFGGVASYATANSGNEFLLFLNNASGTSAGAGVYPGDVLEIYIGGTLYWASISLADDRWHHVAVTWSATTGAVGLLVDGSARSVTSPATRYTGALSSGGTFVLGNDLDSTSLSSISAAQTFTGSLDQVRVWSTVRSASAIAADRYGAASTTTGLVHQWDMDDTGSTLTDNLGTGTLTQTGLGTDSLDVTSPSAATVPENTSGTVYTAANSASAGNDDAGRYASITYSLSGTDAARFTINSSTGAVAFVTAPNRESPTDTGANNVYDAIVTATGRDGYGNAVNLATAAVAISVSNVNEAPGGASSTYALFENGSRAFSAADFRFSDPDAGDTLSAVVITSLPLAGSLTLGGVAVSATQSIPTASLGNLVFTPGNGASGAGYASFGFKVKDAGGLLSPTATITLDVSAINHAPAASGGRISLAEDTARAFGTADFGFSDRDGDSLAAVVITALPAAGSLRLAGVPVTAGQGIAATALPGLVFTPATDANGTGYASLSFKLQDSGGTANGGSNTSAAQTLVFDVSAQPDAPTASDVTVALAPAGRYAFRAADFRFADVDGDSLQAVQVVSLPASGTLAFNGVPAVAGQWIAASQLASLVYTAPASAGSVEGMSFSVRDNSGTANVSSAHSVAFDVASHSELPATSLAYGLLGLPSPPTVAQLVEALGLAEALTGRDYGITVHDDAVEVAISGAVALDTLAASLGLPTLPPFTVTGGVILAAGNLGSDHKAYALAATEAGAATDFYPLLNGLAEAAFGTAYDDSRPGTLSGSGLTLEIGAAGTRLSLASVDSTGLAALIEGFGLPTLAADALASLPAIGLQFADGELAVHALGDSSLDALLTHFGLAATGVGVPAASLVVHAGGGFTFEAPDVSGAALAALLASLPGLPAASQELLAGLHARFVAAVSGMQLAITGTVDAGPLLAAAGRASGAGDALDGLALSTVDPSLSVPNDGAWTLVLPQVQAGALVGRLGLDGSGISLASLGSATVSLGSDSISTAFAGQLAVDLRLLAGSAGAQPISRAVLDGLASTLGGSAGQLALAQPVLLATSDGDRQMQALLQGQALELSRADGGWHLAFEGTVDAAALLRAAWSQAFGAVPATTLQLAATGIELDLPAGQVPRIHVDSIAVPDLQALLQGFGVALPAFATGLFASLPAMSLALDATGMQLSLGGSVDLTGALAALGLQLPAFRIDNPALTVAFTAGVPAFGLDIPQLHGTALANLLVALPAGALPDFVLDFVAPLDLHLAFGAGQLRIEPLQPLDAGGLLHGLAVRLGVDSLLDGISLPAVTPRIHIGGVGTSALTYEVVIPGVDLGASLAGMGLGSFGLDQLGLADITLGSSGVRFAFAGSLQLDAGAVFPLHSSVGFVDAALAALSATGLGNLALTLAQPVITVAADGYSLAGWLDGHPVQLHLGSVQALDYATDDLDLGRALPTWGLAGLVVHSPHVVLATGDYQFANGLDAVRGLRYAGEADLAQLAGTPGAFFRWLGLGEVDAAFTLRPEGLAQLRASLGSSLGIDLGGGFRLSVQDPSVQLDVPATLVPRYSVSGRTQLSGYDPTQSKEPTLTLTGSLSVQPGVMSIGLDSQGTEAWNNPFGLKGVSISRLGIQGGGTTGALTNFGVVGDVAWGSVKLSGGFYIDTVAAQQGLLLTAASPVSLLALWQGPLAGYLAKETGSYGRAANTMMNTVLNLVGLAGDLSVVSFDPDRDGKLDPLVQFAPAPIQLGSTVLPAGYEVNAKLQGGLSGTLLLDANPTFTSVTGALTLPAFRFSSVLSLSAVRAGEPLEISLAASPTSAKLSGTARADVLGVRIAAADFSVTPTSATLANASLDFGLIQLDVPKLAVGLAETSASGTGTLSLLGRQVKAASFMLTPDKAEVRADLTLAGVLTITGNRQDSITTNDKAVFTWYRQAVDGHAANSVDASGTVLLLGRSLGSADVSISSSAIRVTGSADFGVIGVSHASFLWNRDAPTITVSGDFDVLGHAIGGASATVSTSSLAVRGELDLGVLDIDGTFTWSKSTGAVSVRGAVTLELAGVDVTVARPLITVSEQAIDVAGKFTIGPLAFTGARVRHDNDTGALTVEGTATLLGASVDVDRMTLTRTSVVINSAHISLWDGVRVDLSQLNLDPTGGGLHGKASVHIAGYTLASADIDVGDGHIAITGELPSLEIPKVGDIGASVQLRDGIATLVAHTPLGDLETSLPVASFGDIEDLLYDLVLDNIGNLPGYITAQLADGITDLASLISQGFDFASDGLQQVWDSMSSLFSDEDDPVHFNGGSSSNSEEGGDADDALFGNGGNDSLWGHGGEDILDGGAANDYLNGGNDWDTLNGGEGNDRLFGDNGGDEIYGGLGDDHIEGDDLDDYSSGGREFIDGGPGADRIFGGYDADVIFGGAGDDEIWGFDNIAVYYTNEREDGFPDNDLIAGGQGNDTIRGQWEDDLLLGNSGDDSLSGGIGDDVLFGDSPATRSYPSSLEDRVAAIMEAGQLNADLSDAINTLRSRDASHDDLLTLDDLPLDDVATGDDWLDGGSGNDILLGGNGNDTLDGGSGVDSFYGGSGIDALDQRSESANEVADLAQGSLLTRGDGSWLSPDTIESLSSIEDFWSGSGNDIITGSTVANTLLGNDGRDTVVGGGGDDALGGGDGNDSLNGGTGNDTLSGGEGNDALDGGTGDDVLRGGDGNDTLNGSTGADLLDGGAGFDRANYEWVTTAMVVNLAADLVTFSNGGTETVTSIEDFSAGSGNDSLTGDSGANVLRGGGGNDLLFGGWGNDTLWGGSGNDLVRVGADSSVDRVSDFRSGSDKLLLPFLSSATFLGTAGFHTGSAAEVRYFRSDQKGVTVTTVQVKVDTTHVYAVELVGAITVKATDLAFG